MQFDRRKFLKAVPLGAVALSAAQGKSAEVPLTYSANRSAHIKLSCNLYSFNDPLRKGEMTLAEVLRFCSDLGFDAVDPTGYYFPGYPEVPQDEYVYEIKKQAFLLGLDISGTGVRTDFSAANKAKRAADVELVRRWVDVAAKMDAPVLRVYAGRGVPEGHAEREVMDWAVDSIRQCVEYGKQKGVMIVLQNHNELLKTVDQVLYIRNKIATDWLGINLDIGSLRAGDPYEEVAKLAPYAYTWQIKENVYRYGKEEKTDLKKIIQIIRNAGYRGYIPLETLSGDPRVQIPRFLAEVREAMR
ncbi:sugar phosphate isomerase/epimerase [Telluribacter sp. SYSU D00476]|uniref:sugar phosphate isomerase/epimerase family protein n=1 Tax=Telluribacter sp. SYSU D00476 TaxID=2811430 RepID=UPI001FF5DDA6|nr:sugar phosphate isomerase/epimerase family protein [Telluribacter sp. SYSU D00476]